LAAVLVAVPAFGQTASALVREGDSLPGAPAAETISSINNPAVNHVGGYAFQLNTDDDLGQTISYVWGNATGGLGAPLVTEGTYGDYEQTSFESFFGISDAGEAAYSALATHVPSGTTGLDGVWVNTTPILVEEQLVPTLPDFYSSFNSRPGITADGNPYWVGGITDTQGGSTQNRVLFYSTGATVVLMGGDNIGGVPEPLKTGSGNIDFDIRYSALGTHYIDLVLVESGSTSDDGVVVVDGEAATAGGSIMREASPVPAAIGGLPGENWGSFDFFGFTESGNWLVTGDTDADTGADEFILLSGAIVYREGDPVADGVYAGNIEAAYLNEDGDVAYIWEITNDAGNFEALFLNGCLVLMEGDPVDWNGDGVIDPNDGGGVVANFTGITSLAMGDRDADRLVDIYFTADIAFAGGAELEGGFRVTVAPPCPGDVDGDGDTDLNDLAALLAAYGSTEGDPNYNPNADFDENGQIDLSDLAFLLASYGCGT